jgi:hypothetical protein
MLALACAYACTRTRADEIVDAGPYLDVLALDRTRAVTVRPELGGTRSIVAMYDIQSGTRWQATTSHYGGDAQVSGLDASDRIVSVRVVRDGHADVVMLDARDGTPLGTLALTDGWPPSPTGYSLAHVMTVPGRDHIYQVVGDAQRGAVVAVSPDDGKAQWRHDVTGRIDLVTEVGDRVAIAVDGTVALLDVATGAIAGTGGRVEIGDTTGRPYALTADLAALLVPSATSDRGPLDLVFDPGARTLTSADRAAGSLLGVFRWPADAHAPEPHHYRDGVVWLVFPDRLATLDARTLKVR